jgi:hypothetical protein
LQKSSWVLGLEWGRPKGLKIIKNKMLFAIKLFFSLNQFNKNTSSKHF